MNFDDIYRKTHQKRLGDLELEEEHDKASNKFLEVAQKAVANSNQIGNSLSDDEIVDSIATALNLRPWWVKILRQKLGSHGPNCFYFDYSRAMARYVLYKHRNLVFQGGTP